MTLSQGTNATLILTLDAGGRHHDQLDAVVEARVREPPGELGTQDAEATLFWRAEGGPWAELPNTGYVLKSMYRRGDAFVTLSWGELSTLAMLDVIPGRPELAPRLCPPTRTSPYTFHLVPLANGELLAGGSLDGTVSWLVPTR